MAVKNAGVAQLVEQLICNQQVGGSSPSTSSIIATGFPVAIYNLKCGRVPEWPKGADCKSVAFRFGGSNPPSPTNKREYHMVLFFVFQKNEGGFERRIKKMLRCEHFPAVGFRPLSIICPPYTSVAVGFSEFNATLSHQQKRVPYGTLFCFSKKDTLFERILFLYICVLNFCFTEFSFVWSAWSVGYQPFDCIFV